MLFLVGYTIICLVTLYSGCEFPDKASPVLRQLNVRRGFDGSAALEHSADSSCVTGLRRAVQG